MLDAVAEAGPFPPRKDAAGERPAPGTGAANELSEEELAHARDIMRAWPRRDRAWVGQLPEGQRLAVAALCAFLDAQPVPEERCCVSCGRSEFPMRRTAEGWLCRFRPACCYRARLALGMPVWRALKLLEADKAARS
jgi:hypothetical protein